ncbi:hypothetical protein K402DRAFT_460703 [Aulographum hederae CBS 113979]|uniref:HAD-like protein n=1 Tax=Aulographum hederae CBS 113979 TaxID=1176131 RepID=A0A6G1HA77_9PEZI|nr:hypothetical protein K402DRAFT_460703 [Aulographum hederae CBS 113979]
MSHLDSLNLSTYKILAFDIMGTLVDEKIGVETASTSILSKIHSSLSSSSTTPTSSLPTPSDLYTTFTTTLNTLLTSSSPTATPYSTIMAAAISTAATTLSQNTYTPTPSESSAFAAALAHWPAFPDTIPSLRLLSAAGITLVALSNMETSVLSSLTTTGALREVEWAALLGSDIIGAFKPDERMNGGVLGWAEKAGTEREEVLLVANGLGSDHRPGMGMGIEGVWVDRYGGGEEEMGRVGVRPRWWCGSMEELVRAGGLGE